MPFGSLRLGGPANGSTAIVTDQGRLGEPLLHSRSGAYERHRAAYAALPRGAGGGRTANCSLAQ